MIIKEIPKKPTYNVSFEIDGTKWDFSVIADTMEQAREQLKSNLSEIIKLL